MQTSSAIPSNNIKTSPQSHAINRSAELLSVARTALRITQQQQQQQQQHDGHQTTTTKCFPLLEIKPSDLTLYSNSNYHQMNAGNAALDALAEAMLTLHLLDTTLMKLSNLVKRRGHTNDPTNDINIAMTDFQSFVKDIMDILQVTLPQASSMACSNSRSLGHNRNTETKQRKKHYEMAGNVLKTKVETRMENFKNIMKVRGDVLKDLTLRRNRLLKNNDETNGNNSESNNQHGSNYLDMTGSNRNHQNGNHTMLKHPILNGAGNRIANNNNNIRIGALKKSNVMGPSKVKSQLNSPLFNQLPISSSGTAKHNPYIKSNNNMNNNNNYTTNNNNNPYQLKQPMKSPLQPSMGEGKAAYNSYGYSSAGYGGVNNTGCHNGTSGYGGAGYGGYSNLSNTGMRKRGTATPLVGGGGHNNQNDNQYNPYQMEEETKIHTNNSHNNNQDIQTVIQQRREARQTQSRLESAKMAEKTIAEIATMFSKMSNLIHTQGETLVKIEDDVEVAMVYVDDGYEEIGKLYEWTKGNRGLILKCILIFFIIFMKFYG